MVGMAHSRANNLSKLNHSVKLFMMIAQFCLGIVNENWGCFSLHPWLFSFQLSFYRLFCYESMSIVTLSRFQEVREILPRIIAWKKSFNFPGFGWDIIDKNSRKISNENIWTSSESFLGSAAFRQCSISTVTPSITFFIWENRKLKMSTDHEKVDDDRIYL